MNKEADLYHTPVLLAESVEGLAIRENGVYVDLTFGGGGHSRAILARLGTRGRLYGFDQDMAAAANVPPDSRFIFVYSNFRYLSNFLRYYGIREVDGILADLGVSSHHFDNEKRGFSYRFDSMLDMRMNQFAGQTAADVLNTYPEHMLKEILDTYGELNQSRKIAARIAALRKTRPFRTVPDLLELAEPFTPRGKEKKFLSQIFQALRIEVNDELQALREMLKQSFQALKPGGRFAVITYHSLEDRLVKYFFRTGNTEGLTEPDFFGNLRTPFIQINNRVIVPAYEEAMRNPRARSAKLRIAEKKQEYERGKRNG
ncbi:MAG: 16S rRNA (cytosine(1402)-N(4))-methyltransferase RsmH [Tannerella sp.]|jgi:16S rRNA (cytosine1402-N4)-methyltransferase|nr:16S rRNA (cytosine(1402)-N(4))-methyltransferase RsmH [Tannerella sp.]